MPGGTNQAPVGNRPVPIVGCLSGSDGLPHEDPGPDINVSLTATPPLSVKLSSLSLPAFADHVFSYPRSLHSQLNRRLARNGCS